MKLETFFDGVPIYIINLADSVDRRNHIQKQFGSMININFISAVDGRKSGTFYNEYMISFHNNSNKFSTGLIAVICSHIRAIYTAYHNGDEYAIILEDDVWTDLIPKCSFTMKDICAFPGDWELIQLFCSSDDIIKSNYENFQKQGL